MRSQAGAWERGNRHEASPYANAQTPDPSLVLANPSARTPGLDADSCLEHEFAVSRKQTLVGQLSVVSCSETRLRR
jgi:hypothetical protein